MRLHAVAVVVVVVVVVVVRGGGIVVIVVAGLITGLVIYIVSSAHSDSESATQSPDFSQLSDEELRQVRMSHLSVIFVNLEEYFASSIVYISML